MWVHPVESRYGSERMRSVFRQESRIRMMAEVEAIYARALAKRGVIPAEAAEAIERASKEITPSDVLEEERVTKHETMALVRALSKRAGAYGEYLHLGLTSNDVLDTVMGIQIREAGSLIVREAASLLRSIIRRGEESIDVVCLGRTHGVVADPIPLSMKFAYWSYLVRSSLRRFMSALDEACVGKLRGAVGTLAASVELGVGDPLEVESEVLSYFGLKQPEITTQIVPRDKLAFLIVSMSLFSSALDTIANEIRNLHRTEIGEIREHFEESQVGSSTMPHKMNPIGSEKVCGLARLMRSLALAAMENIVLEHERDLTNSSVERMMLPEAFLVLEEQIRTLTKVIEGLDIDRLRIEENLRRYADLALSERLMISLVRRGLGRQEAHEIVRRISLKSQRSGRRFLDEVMEDEEISKVLRREEIEGIFKPESYVGLGREISIKEFEVAKEFLKGVLANE
ncbi:MAG: adenylosuccinate lyase [Candidatus Korarchaeota archaeon NZ13-K]|nr:MAG: adenylosuccinate lyase [Candidatus Korarchaeota archaeon NZ13-K]